jgi:predicted negative regulator of RcsB-dependent stress response
MTDIVHEYRQKKIANVQFMQMAISWKGVTNVLGWQGLAPTLSPSIRARMTYLMGHRLMKLGRRNDAIAFWRQALDQAKSDERLRTLAQAQLEAFSVP